MLYMYTVCMCNVLVFRIKGKANKQPMRNQHPLQHFRYSLPVPIYSMGFV